MNNNHIDLDDQETWPENLKEILLKNIELIENHYTKEQEIDAITRNDWQAKRHPPRNEYQPAYEELSRQCHNILKNCQILGYHCSPHIDHAISAFS